MFDFRKYYEFQRLLETMKHNKNVSFKMLSRICMATSPTSGLQGFINPSLGFVSKNVPDFNPVLKTCKLCTCENFQIHFNSVVATLNHKNRNTFKLQAQATQISDLLLIRLDSPQVIQTLFYIIFMLSFLCLVNCLRIWLQYIHLF